MISVAAGNDPGTALLHNPTGERGVIVDSHVTGAGAHTLWVFLVKLEGPQKSGALEGLLRAWIHEEVQVEPVIVDVVNVSNVIDTAANFARTQLDPELEKLKVEDAARPRDDAP